MSYNYSSYDKFGMKNDVERYFNAGWRTLVVICSLIGDSTILVASIKYKAFNVHKIVVVVIQHIAVSDLMHAVFSILPTIVPIICNSGGSNKILNYASFFIQYYVNNVGASLIAALTLSKLLLLKYPLKTGPWTTKQAHKICAILWVTSLGTPTWHLLISKDDVIFDYRVYNCSYLYSSSIWKVMLPISAFVAFVIPNCINLVSTVLLLKEARIVVRGTEDRLRWQGIMTVVLTATVYTISFLPITVYSIAEPFVEKKSVPGPFFIEFYRIALSFLYLNTLANFFVYGLTVTSFRWFLKAKFHQIALFLSNKNPSAGDFPQKLYHFVQLRGCN